MAKNSVTIRPATEWVEVLKFKRPDLCVHGMNYATECLYADACGLPRPVPPREREYQGALNRGKQITKAARKNGSKKKAAKKKAQA